MVNRGFNYNYTIREINVLVDSRSSTYGDEYEIDLPRMREERLNELGI